MASNEQQLDVLLSVIRAESLYSESERKRALALMLKLNHVSSRIIADLIGVSAPSIQGWWRDWQVDPDFVAIVDRRRAYAIDEREKARVEEYLQKEPPAGLDSWSIRALSKVLRIKQQHVETILKVMCYELPERVPGDERLRSGVYDRGLPASERTHKSEPIPEDRQRVFDDALSYLERLESGVLPNSDQQKVFDDVLNFIEHREEARERGEPYTEVIEPLPKRKRKSKKLGSKTKRIDPQREQRFEDALRFITDRERERDS